MRFPALTALSSLTQRKKLVNRRLGEALDRVCRAVVDFHTAVRLGDHSAREDNVLSESLVSLVSRFGCDERGLGDSDDL